MMSRMDDLAPDITRQRLLIEGYYTVDVDEPVIERYFSTSRASGSTRGGLSR
jgi:hypothetical protein